MFSRKGEVICTTCGSSMKLATIDYKSAGEMEIQCHCEVCKERRVIQVGNRECQDYPDQSAA